MATFATEYFVGRNLMSLLQQALRTSVSCAIDNFNRVVCSLTNKDRKLPEYSTHKLACGLVRALLYLHSKGIIYCDLKLSNILLDENGITKVLVKILRHSKVFLLHAQLA
ncbi:hypothetical protein KY285_010595 [Solanum tuberosum]|nr:hypothetical protein KY285_010595 [Solanum tuberosum]